ncbi:MAG TPA: pantoate--beta-alanine ligase, partial [Elusimicrobiota bacterium]|nr:pantoate--beta-alanine ligase [Elusimicrobiota bacterium]
MKIVRRPSDCQKQALAWRAAGRTIGLVPTMGALHEGHASLLRRARRENDRVIATVFVNPAQFGPAEDFKKYPRPFARDAALCRAAGVDLLLAPRPESMYAPDHDAWVTVPRTAAPLCGAFRPGHFRGVATVVAQLFNLAQPTRAYFGAKDYQQTRVVARLAADLHFPVKVVVCPTVREASGLARSSRNRYLSDVERTAAPALWRALRSAAQVLKSRRNAAAARRAARAELARVPGLRPQYIDVVDPRSLAPWRSGPAVIA